MHYSQETPRIEVNPDDGLGLLRVRGSGFVTRDLLRRELGGYLRGTVQEVSRGLMVDLRDVAGYGYGCGPLAQRALREGASLGLERVALVSGSSVVRTASSMLAADAGVVLRCFPDPDAAEAWLGSTRTRTAS